MAANGTQSSRPTTSRRPRDPLGASARPRPPGPRSRGPGRHQRGPSGQPPSPRAQAAVFCGRARLAPGVRGPAQARGERPGAPRFSQTPTWRRPPPATTTPPRAADGPGTVEGSVGKFRFSSPGPPGTGAQPTSSFTYPAGRGRRRRRRRSDSSSSRAPGADSARSSAPASQGVCSQRPSAAGAIRTRRAGGRAGRRPAPPLAGDSPAAPVEPHNVRLGWPLPCACTGAPPPTRQARALGYEHTHQAHSPPFLACPLAPPVRPRALCSMGRGLSEGHTHLGSRDRE